MTKHLEDILNNFRKIVTSDFCEEMARETQFVKRSTSQLKGYEFAQAMMIPNAYLESETLHSLAVRMQRINPSCNLSAPALAQRINSKAAVRFMKNCFGYVLKEVIKRDSQVLPDLPNLMKFNRILIQDSTKAELHEKLSPYFQGSGGVASISAVKIDYIFDYLSEGMVDIEFVCGKIPDQSLANRIIPMLKEGDLVIRDLGYYLLDSIQQIENMGAYYISRFKADVNVYESKTSKTPFDLAKFLDERTCQGIVDVEVFIGKERHAIRLVACLMSEEAVNERLRKANKTASRRRAAISKKKRKLLKYNIFITNCPSEMLSASVVMSTYRARWRIEIFHSYCLRIIILLFLRASDKSTLWVDSLNPQAA